MIDKTIIITPKFFFFTNHSDMIEAKSQSQNKAMDWLQSQGPFCHETAYPYVHNYICRIIIVRSNVQARDKVRRSESKVRKPESLTF